MTIIHRQPLREINITMENNMSHILKMKAYLLNRELSFKYCIIVCFLTDLLAWIY